jgi:nucleoside-diphosphate kinase
MALQRTFAIIKPDAMEAGNAGNILAHIQKAGFVVRGMRQLHLTLAQAEGFYEVHRARPFFGELTTFMSRGPIVVLALEADDAINKWRDVIGATNPAQAAEGTIRERFGKDVGENAVHGSDGPDTAAHEIAYFFAGYEVRATV